MPLSLTSSTSLSTPPTSSSSPDFVVPNARRGQRLPKSTSLRHSNAAASFSVSSFGTYPSTLSVNTIDYPSVMPDSSSNTNSVKKAMKAAFGLTSSKPTLAPSPRLAVSQPSLAAPLPKGAAKLDLVDIKIVNKINRAVANVKVQGRKAIAAVRRKLNSKTPKEELPKTWEEYSDLYARNAIDIDDPPLPPNAGEPSVDGKPTPYDERFWAAPKPFNEAERQAMVVKLDLFGTHGTHPTPAGDASMRTSLLRRDSIASSLNSAAPTTASTPASIQAETVASLENHPAFRAIIQQCRDMFKTRVALITVLDDESQLFLATGGLPDGVETLPRSVSFCTHAILNEDAGLVVLDSQKDWRFANNVPSAVLGARFYAGVPLLAPTFGDPNAPSIPIGTLCVLDDRPHDSFTDEQREQLRVIAAQASQEVESWVVSRMGNKLERLEDSFKASQISTPDNASIRTTSTSRTAPTPAPVAALPPPPPTVEMPRTSSTRAVKKESVVAPPTPPESLRRAGSASHSRHSSESSSSGSSASSPTSEVMTPSTSIASSLRSAHFKFTTTTEEPVTPIAKELQKTFDTATRMLSKALELSLVYLVSLDLSALAIPGEQPSLRLLSAYNLPHPAPSFDPALHLKALRAPEGGLLYKNPRERDSTGGPGYSSGILIPIMEVRRAGYVLCGYTSDRKRAFGDKEMSLFVKMAESLEVCVAQLGR